MFSKIIVSCSFMITHCARIPNAFMNNSYMPSKFTVTFSLIVTNCTGLDNLVNLSLKVRHDF